MQSGPEGAAVEAAAQRSSFLEYAGVAAGCFAVTLLFMAPLVAAAGSTFPENAGDARANAWLLAWGADRLAHGLAGFWDPPILYPYQDSLAYSENLLGIAVLVAPVHWLFQNPTLTYNSALLLSFVIAGVGMYALARELTGRRDAAVVAALAFAFAPYRWAQLTHLQVLSVGWMPLALWALHRLVRAPSWPVAAALVLAVVLQVLSSGYAAFQLAFAATLVAVWLIAVSSRGWIGVRRLALVTLVAAVIMAPAVAAYAHVWTLARPSDEELAGYSADLSSYLDTAPGLPDHAWTPGMSQDEGHLFPGVAVSIAALVALLPVARRRLAGPSPWLYAMLAAFAVSVSLGPEPRAWGAAIPAPPVYSWLLSTLPLFGALRVPARFGMLAILAVSVLAGLGTAKIAAGLRPRVARAVVAALCAVVLWEGYGGPLRVEPVLRAEGAWDKEVYRWLAQQPDGAVLALPMPHQAHEGREFEYQFAALVHGHRAVNGVGRFETPLQFILGGSASPLFDASMAAEAIPFLRGAGIRWLLVRYRDFNSEPLATHVAALLDGTEGVRRVAYRDQFAVYEVAPGPPRVEDATGLTRVSAAAFRLSASPQPDRVGLMVDGDAASRWRSGAPQAGTEWIAIDFDRPRRIGRLDFQFGPATLADYPRRLDIVSEDGTTLYAGGMLEALGRGLVRAPDHPVASLTLAERPVSRLLVRQVGTSATWYWSIDELTIWERQ